MEIPNCERHRWDLAEDECRVCNHAYCASCLVYVNGAKARPLCIQCALKRSGVRGSAKVRPSWRERRVQAKAEKVVARSRARTPHAAASAVDDDSGGHRQPGWVSLDASRWDVGAI